MTVTDARLTIIIIITLSIVSPNRCQINTNTYDRDDNNVTSRVLKIINNFRELQLDQILKTSDFYNVTELFRSRADNECNQQLNLFTQGIITQEIWALKMLDASSKIPAGILNGNMKDLGMYDECLSIKENKDNQTIQGRHCMYMVSVDFSGSPTKMALTLSSCLPSVCDSEQVKGFLQTVIEMGGVYVNTSGINIESVICSLAEPRPWSTGGIVTLSFMSILLSFLIICTINDILMKTKIIKNTENVVLNNLSKFSFYTNSQNILSTKTPNGTLSAITGLRFFSMAWVILGHNYLQPLFGAVINFADVGEWIRSWNSVYILIAPFAVDTFFVMSGFLTAYLFLKEIKRGQKFNIFTYYIHRYIRLTPALGVLILLTIYIFPHFGDGALWDISMDNQSASCSKYWWRIIIYIQNYSPKNTMECLGHAWYLAVDMHFFVISPFILYPLSKKPTLGLYILSALIIASFIIPAVIANINRYSGALFPTDLEAMQDMMLNFYVTSHTRAGPWLLGIYGGYKLQTSKEHPCNNLIRLGWAVTFAAFAFIIFTFRIFQNSNYSYNIYWETIYAGCSRHIWAFAICWIIYASSIGYGGVINKLLSFPIYLPFSRISYCVYLIHFINETMKISASRTSLYFSDLQMLNIYLSDFVLCILGGFVFTLCFESPFLALEKIIFGDTRRKNNNGDHSVEHTYDSQTNEEVIENTRDSGIENQGYEEMTADDNNDSSNNNNYSSMKV